MSDNLGHFEGFYPAAKDKEEVYSRFLGGISGVQSSLA
jgi:hypothetical protein